MQASLQMLEEIKKFVGKTSMLRIALLAGLGGKEQRSLRLFWKVSGEDKPSQTDNKLMPDSPVKVPIANRTQVRIIPRQKPDVEDKTSRKIRMKYRGIIRVRVCASACRLTTKTAVVVAFGLICHLHVMDLGLAIQSSRTCTQLAREFVIAFCSLQLQMSLNADFFGPNHLATVDSNSLTGNWAVVRAQAGRQS
ncbi:unnamed protein product [Protopolystoma xenopodis]|uniref:Uncharacterized protein n=1 Tax=Protopolystoma xenopodis TaxID=117903 RepID=A0A3S5A0R4_9PLAT|nr:unnamed protein product [Protopolystoma xenopodis]